MESAFTPFFRRFTDEKAREYEELDALFARVASKAGTFNETMHSLGRRLLADLPRVPEGVHDKIAYALYDIYTDEKYLWEMPQIRGTDLKGQVDARNALIQKERFLDKREEYLTVLTEGLRRIFSALLDGLPETAAPSPFTIPLIYALPNPRQAINDLMDVAVCTDFSDRGIAAPFAEQMYKNLCAASGREAYEETKKPYKFPRDSTLPLDQLAKTYLGGTRLYDMAMAPVPLMLTNEVRFDHMHIVGGTGAGKTTLIENLILHDLQSDDPPSLVLIDPHGDLIQKLTRADLGIRDRLIIIDPRDIQHPPALNVFALNQERLGSYDESTREQVTAGVIQTFDYLFSGLIGADLTAKQGVFFRYVARLMLALPETMGRNATILDMLKLMTDPSPYQGAIASLSDIPRDFFLHDFPSKTFQQTKEQIRYRLQAILENPTMARLFTSPETKVDLFTAMNSGAIIVVDTAKDYLKGASANFGRIFISLVLQAVLERAAIPAKERKDTFLIVDEAASYFDSNIDDLLTEARKYRCGLVLAHQYLDQASHALRASLAANTGTKFASGLSSGDARSMAPDMRTTPDFILEQPKLQFAAHIRNVTPNAVSIPVTPGILERQQKLSNFDYQDLLEQNRAKVSIKRIAAPPSPIMTEPTEISDDEW